MSRALSGKDLAMMLDGLKGAKVERITHIAGSQVAFQLRYQGKLLKFSANIL